MEDGLWVGQFGIIDGTCQEESPWAGIFPARGHGEEEPADLYMVVEPTLQDSQEHCAHLVAANRQPILSEQAVNNGRSLAGPEECPRSDARLEPP